MLITCLCWLYSELRFLIFQKSFFYFNQVMRAGRKEVQERGVHLVRILGEMVLILVSICLCSQFKFLECGKLSFNWFLNSEGAVLRYKKITNTRQ